MRYVAPTEGRTAHLELTRRNLESLLAKLDDPSSSRTLIKQEEAIVGDGWVKVTAVEDEVHYADRPPGAIYMPTTGEWL